MSDNYLKVGEYNILFNKLLGLEMKCFNIYRSKGLPAHMLKSHHEKCLKYIDYIPDIIIQPDFIGINPNESRSQTFELVKKYKDNILIGIKLDMDNNLFYVSTMYDVSESKLQRRLHSGRLVKFIVDKNNEE